VVHEVKPPLLKKIIMKNNNKQRLFELIQKTNPDSISDKYLKSGYDILKRMDKHNQINDEILMKIAKKHGILFTELGGGLITPHESVFEDQREEWWKEINDNIEPWHSLEEGKVHVDGKTYYYLAVTGEE